MLSGPHGKATKHLYCIYMNLLKKILGFGYFGQLGLILKSFSTGLEYAGRQRQIEQPTIGLATPGIAVGDPGAKVGRVERERRVGGGASQRAADAGQAARDHGQLLPHLPLQHAVQCLPMQQPHPVNTSPTCVTTLHRRTLPDLHS